MVDIWRYLVVKVIISRGNDGRVLMDREKSFVQLQARTGVLELILNLAFVLLILVCRRDDTSLDDADTLALIDIPGVIHRYHITIGVLF